MAIPFVVQRGRRGRSSKNEPMHQGSRRAWYSPESDGMDSSLSHRHGGNPWSESSKGSSDSETSSDSTSSKSSPSSSDSYGYGSKESSSSKSYDDDAGYSSRSSGY